MSKLSLLYASKRKIRFATFGWQGQVCYVRHHFDEKLSKAYAENCLKARPLFQNCEQKIKFVRGSGVSQKCNIFGFINQNKKQNRTKQKKSWLALFPKLIHPHPSENVTLPKEPTVSLLTTTWISQSHFFREEIYTLEKGQAINTALCKSSATKW